uniref:Uncharacterized protein n=1 Tax=Arundo donax TaxID=35708 RepID=A0A0A9BR77_ARUDO
MKLLCRDLSTLLWQCPWILVCAALFFFLAAFAF